MPTKPTVANLRWDNSASNADYLRSQLATETKSYPIEPWEWRIHDAMHTNLGATPTSDDDLQLTTGTLGTHNPRIQTGDVKNVTKTRYARVQKRLPAEYVSGGTITLRFSAGMETTAAQTSAEIDAQVYASDREDGVSGDICATNAQNINVASYADKDFTITPTGRVAGDVLDIRVAIATVDGQAVNVVIGSFGACELVCQVKG